MATYVAPSTSIVHEVLKMDNYGYWSACVESYLQGQGLWETVSKGWDGQTENKEEWERENKAALHAIQISCGPQFFSSIENIGSAKYCWEILAERLDPKPQWERQPQVPSETTSETIELPPAQKDEMMRYINNGDWKRLKAMLVKNLSLKNTRIAENGGTALHKAVKLGHLRVVEGLVGMMEPKDLEIKDGDGKTALIYAATIGSTEMARCMIGKNDNLANIGVDHNGVFESYSPLSFACEVGHKDAAKYLYTKTSIDFLSRDDGWRACRVLESCIYGEMLDIALDLLHCLPDSCKVDVIKDSDVLLLLSNKPGAFPSGNRLAFWQRWIYWSVRVPKFVPSVGVSQIDIDVRLGVPSTIKVTDENPVLHRLRRLPDYLLDILGIKLILDMRYLHVRSVDLVDYICDKIKDLDAQEHDRIGMYHAFAEAAKLGISELVLKLGEIQNDLFHSKLYANGINLLMLSIIHRQENIFGEISSHIREGRGYMGALIPDKFGNTLLHLAGLLSPPSQLARISGAALQMQRELQWYKEVESISNPKFKHERNYDRETPSKVFTRCHKDLMAEGEKWMKDTATSCTVVGALIITIMFTAVFTVPGGNQDTGLPLFLHKASFRVFIISDAISLFSSSTSVITFLGILTTRYAEQDFYRFLPRQLVIGLSSLLLSIATMMIAFCATLFIILDEELSYIVPITSLAAAPVVFFMFLQFSLLVDIINSTYGPNIFSRKISLN